MFIHRLLTRNDAKETAESSSKWQQKLHLAQINPEPDLDLTDCAIKCLPKGTYSQCLIFRKNRLLFSGNGLSTLPDDDDNRLSDLIDFCVILDLSRNQLNSLPPNLGNLLNLKELHLAHNRIKSIPESFVSMRSLETIDLSHNQLNQFPRVLCDLTTLKHIDISYNQLITRLPSTICNLIKLEKLLTNGTNINHPPKRICDEGIESIYKIFKQSQLIDDGPEIIGACSPLNQLTYSKKPSNESEKDHILSYLIAKDDRKRRLIEFEKSLLDETKLIEATNRKTFDKKQEILMQMKRDQRVLHEGLESLFVKRIEDKSNIIKALALIEEHSSQLVDQLKSFNSRIQSSNHQGDDQLVNSLEVKLRQLMISKDLSKESLRTELIKEDESLYRAFCDFMDAKDTQNRILSEKIGLIEHELHHLTKAEIQRRNNNLDQQTTKINGQRMALASLLKDLLDERNKLNQQKEDSSILLVINDQLNRDKDSWKLDPNLNRLLNCLDSSLSQLYAPLFADCSMTLRQFVDLSDDELKSFGINEEHIPLIRKHADLGLSAQSNSPSAPYSDEINCEPIAPPMKLYLLIECVICLDEKSKIILIPCGHVCTCTDCSKSLELCPLCRSEISEKIESDCLSITL